MTPIACTLIRRLAPVLAPALLLAALACREDAESPTAPDPAPSGAVTATTALAFRQVSAGEVHTCGVTTDNRAYCWGLNFAGQLGDGTNTGPETCVGPTSCSTRPVAVLGGLRFRQVSAGSGHTCGVTTDDRAYCWGRNASGQLGDRSKTDRLTPVAVVGGHRFRQVSAGFSHTCGLTADRVALCWGDNRFGQLGDSTEIRSRVRPVLVAGGHQFRQLDAGGLHTCAVTTSDRAFCWGDGRFGQIGDGKTFLRLWPRRVAGGLSFERVTAGQFHTCGETTTNRAYCWGRNGDGELGNGTRNNRSTPVAVAGGLHFSQVSAGPGENGHTCGKTAAAVTYCWGANFTGQLGDATTTDRLTPVAVSGGLPFAQVSAGGFHTCAVTAAAAAYCWGDNGGGQLGDGTTTDRLTPTPVVGP